MWAEVRRHLEDPATLTRAAQQAGTDGSQLGESAAGARLRQGARRQQVLEHEATRLLDAYQAGALELAQFARRQTALGESRHRLAQERRGLAEQQAAAGHQQTIHQGLAAFSRHIRTRLQELLFSERQELVRLVVDTVTVRDHHVAIYFKIPIEISPRHPSAPVPQPTSGKPVST